MVKVIVGDMLYPNEGVGNKVCPVPIGYVVAYAKKMLGESVDIKLCKHPEDLIRAVENENPDVIALSNYSWTANLSSALLSSFKQNNPNLVTVMGGPNYPREEALQEEFFQRCNGLDFYVHMEGEQGFLSLLNRIVDSNGDIQVAKTEEIAGVHFVDPKSGHLATGQAHLRLTELDDIPSPYLTGLMDDFLDMGLQPMIQTNRGCPFTCTFCVEGQKYHSKVRRFSIERISAELKYLAERVSPHWPLSITDSNFGMYEQDVETCKVLRGLQDEYGWPNDINVSTGKNRVDRVTECAELTRGAISVSLQIQSMDSEVLKNIRRQNISVDGLKKAVENTQELSKTTRAISAVIVPLPGETFASHISGLKELVDMDMDYVCPFQLMLLYDTEISSSVSREKYQMQTMWRPVPNYYGQFGGVSALELEEICVSTNTFSIDDYYETRGLHFFLLCFHADDAMLEFRKYLQQMDISPFDWIRESQLKIDTAPASVRDIYDRFLEATKSELWNSRESALEFVRDGNNIDLFVDGELGDNVLFKYRAICMTSAFEDFLHYGAKILSDIVLSRWPDRDSVKIKNEIDDITNYIYCLRRLPLDSIEIQDAVKGQFSHDITAWKEDGYSRPLETYHSESLIDIEFRYTSTQIEKLNYAYDQLGNSVQGIGQMVRKYNPLFFVRETARAGYQGIVVPIRSNVS